MHDTLEFEFNRKDKLDDQHDDFTATQHKQALWEAYKNKACITNGL